jgi:hypothetical protein
MRISAKYGVNPTIPVCFYCRTDKNEVALLGAAYHGQAPTRMVLDRQPCEQCQTYMKRGIILIEASGDEHAPIILGGYAVLTEEAVRRMLGEPMLSQVLSKRMCFLDAQAWDLIGLRGMVVTPAPPRETMGDV